MRLLCQKIAQRINSEDQATGKVWENRYRAVRLLDEASLLACAAYVDLNPIRAAIAETLEQSDYTSVQRRIQALKQELEHECLGGQADTADRDSMVADRLGVSMATSGKEGEGGVSEALPLQPTSANSVDQVGSAGMALAVQRSEGLPAASKPDRMLAPIQLDELRDALQLQASRSGYRCSDRGFLNMTVVEYITLLDWTARSLVSGKRGATPKDIPTVFERLNLGISAETWCELVGNFGRLFKIVAGKARVVEAHRGKGRPKRFKLSRRARELLSA